MYESASTWLVSDDTCVSTQVWRPQLPQQAVKLSLRGSEPMQTAMQQPARNGHSMHTPCQASSLRACRTSHRSNTA